MVREAHRQASFADLELQRQGVGLDQTLQTISDFLEQNQALVDQVHQDLVRGLKKATTGREGIEASRVLRSFLLRRLKNWDYRELRERIADGFSLRQFTHFYADPVPSYRAFHRSFQRLSAQTVRALNEAVVQAAVESGIEDAKKLRVDTTVVQTDIHHPTDSTLLWDTVRTLCRLVKRVGELVPELTQGFRNRSRRARRRMLDISRMERAERPRQQRRKYKDLLEVTEETLAQARAVVEKSQKVRVLDLLVAEKLQSGAEEILHFCELGERVINQTRRRVLQGETVPVGEKIFSIFEVHTDLIKRGKVVTPVEFGHKIFLAESAQGLITDYRILQGNPKDEQQVEPSLDHHHRVFGVAPELYAADRGFYSQANLERCEKAGVKTVCVPYAGRAKTAERKAEEKTRRFKQGQRFRAGIEGRISVLFRGRGMKRCPDEGPDRFEVFVGAAVLANNLLLIAHHLNKRKRRPGRRSVKRTLQLA
jgi:IS5 family transposase